MCRRNGREHSKVPSGWPDYDLCLFPEMIVEASAFTFSLSCVPILTFLSLPIDQCLHSKMLIIRSIILMEFQNSYV